MKLTKAFTAQHTIHDMIVYVCSITNSLILALVPQYSLILVDYHVRVNVRVHEP